MPIFEIVLAGTPVSQQTRRRSRVRGWTEDVRRQASGSIAEHSPLEGHLAASIVYFAAGIDIDVDNIAKPLLDGLKGVVFESDAQIVDCHIFKRSVTTPIDVLNSSAQLDDAILLGTHFTFVRVSTVEPPLTLEIP